MDAKAIIDRMKLATGSKTYAELAEKMGVSLSAIDRWKSRGVVPEKNIDKCALLTGKSVDWIRTGEKNDDEDGTVPVHIMKYQAGAGKGIYNFEPQQTIMALSPELFPFVKEGKAIAVEVIGDSMEPTLRNGDYIIITPDDEVRRDNGIYAIVVGGTVMVKSLQFQLDGSIRIISDNPKYATETYNPDESQVEFRIIGPMRLRVSR